MAIMDDIRRMMAQRAAQGIGTGGGLFGTTNTQGQSTGLLGGLQNINPNLLIGAAITGAGMKGQDPFSSILPATLQAAQISKYLTPEKKDNFRQLTNKEKEERGLPLNKQFQINTKTDKVSQVGGSSVNVNLGQPISQGISVANQYEKESKKFIDRNASRTQILALTDTKEERTPQQDFDLVYAYYKFLDPGSTVRETEFANLERLGSVGRRIKKIIPKWSKGRLLTDDQVQEIRDSMEKQFTGFAEEQDTRFKRFSTLLSESKLDPSLFLQNYNVSKTESKKNKDEIDYSSLSTEELLKLYNQ
jgi:hypothetical protein|tara:strand:+ start:55 stop:966 length:912 start_codon:yes stop_codon:yes gene_type:complete